jgi:hypothetical protein
VGDKMINEEYSYDIFFGEVNGIKIDNAYDIYQLNTYKKMYAEKNYNYIDSQDNDLSYLTLFKDIEYIKIPREAENLDFLYELPNLKGMNLYSSCLNKLDITQFKDLKDLFINEDDSIINFEDFNNIKSLYLNQFKFKDLNNIVKLDIEMLTIDFCEKLESLEGIEKLPNLNELIIIYCKKLSNISKLKEIKNKLIKLSLFDCNRINDFQVFNELNNLEELKLINDNPKGMIFDIQFLQKMHNLQVFVSNFKIKKDDLTLLRQVKNVEIIK